MKSALQEQTNKASQRLMDTPFVTGPRPQTQAAAPIWVWGVPLIPFSIRQTVTAIRSLVEADQPSYFITANVHYALLTEQNPDLQIINAKAAFILADGAPLVWASRWLGSPLPERVAGSDLVYELSADAAKTGHRLFLLGGADGVAETAARHLSALYPGLDVATTECPSLHEMTPQAERALIARIRAMQPHVLLVAFGQPKGERWVYKHLAELGVPVSVQVGASLDFVAGRIRRAPRWMQRFGLEWAFRLSLEPRRLFGRYVRDAWFIARMLARDLRRGRSGSHAPGAPCGTDSDKQAGADPTTQTRSASERAVD
jgi:N-acetylglucosaminyldiphosphoundecaprenol N-acetyl-beta-D-mannosaminyltransferase